MQKSYQKGSERKTRELPTVTGGTWCSSKRHLSFQSIALCQSWKSLWTSVLSFLGVTDCLGMLIKMELSRENCI